MALPSAACVFNDCKSEIACAAVKLGATSTATRKMAVRIRKGSQYGAGVYSSQERGMPNLPFHSST